MEEPENKKEYIFEEKRKTQIGKKNFFFFFNLKNNELNLQLI